MRKEVLLLLATLGLLYGLLLASGKLFTPAPCQGYGPLDLVVNCVYIPELALKAHESFCISPINKEMIVVGPWGIYYGIRNLDLRKQVTWTSQDPGGGVYALGYSQDGKVLALCLGTKAGPEEIALLRTADLTLINKWTNESDSIPGRRLWFSTDNTLLIGRLTDGIKIWKTSDGSVVASLRHPGEELRDLVVHNGQILVAFEDTKSNRVSVHKIDDAYSRFQQVASIPDAIRPLTNLSVAFSANGGRIAMVVGSQTGHEGTISIYDTSDGHVVARLPDNKAHLAGLALSSTGSLVAFSLFDATVTVWDTRSESEVVTLNGFRGAAQRVAFFDNDRMLLTSDQTATVVWDVSVPAAD